jgi:hypothetical protein
VRSEKRGHGGGMARRRERQDGKRAPLRGPGMVGWEPPTDDDDVRAGTQPAGCRDDVRHFVPQQGTTGKNSRDGAMLLPSAPARRQKMTKTSATRGPATREGTDGSELPAYGRDGRTSSPHTATMGDEESARARRRETDWKQNHEGTVDPTRDVRFSRGCAGVCPIRSDPIPSDPTNVGPRVATGNERHRRSFNNSRVPTLLKLQRETELSFAPLVASSLRHLLCVGLSRVRGSLSLSVFSTSW